MEKFECVECYEEYKEEDMIESKNAELFCEDCADEDLINCDNCDELSRNDEMNYSEYHGEHVCDDCLEDEFVISDCCNDIVHEREAIRADDNGELFCDLDCLYDNGGVVCDNCGDTVSYENARRGDYGSYCSVCDTGSDYIRDYHDNPYVEFYGEAENNRFFGVELELDDGNPHDFAEDFNEETEERIFLMEDSSLSCNGVEVISQPMSLYEHMDGGVWEDVRDYALKHQLRSHDTNTCGLHIHVSRDGFSCDDAIDNAIFIVNRFWNKMRKFSRRDISELRKWADKTVDRIDEEVTIQSVKEASKYGRYNAINLNNSATIEFRLFKGSLRVATIKASIQLVDLITRVSNMYADNDESIDSLEWEFITQLAKDDYELLYEELVRLELV